MNSVSKSTPFYEQNQSPWKGHICHHLQFADDWQTLTILGNTGQPLASLPVIDSV